MVSACLTDFPQFAFMAGRSTHHALYRVLQHCRAGRHLVAQQRLRLIDKFRGAHAAQCQGALQISLDYSKAFDSMDRKYIKPALLRCGVPLSDVHTIEQWHMNVHYYVHGATGAEAKIGTNQGIRQGCAIAPTLWAAYTLLVMDAVRQKFGEEWLAQHLTLFADDTHCGWLFYSETELHQVFREVAELLDLLTQMGLKINDSKSASLFIIGGTHANRLRKQLIPGSDNPMLTFNSGSSVWRLPLVRKHVYLGVCIGYHNFEDDTLAHRIKQASGNFARLRTILLSKRYLSMAWRVRLWRAVIFSSLERGIYCAGLTKRGVSKLRIFALRQIRAIASSPVCITRETHQQVLSKLNLDDPFYYIIKAAAKAHRLAVSCHTATCPEAAHAVLHDLRAVLLPPLDAGSSLGQITCQQCGRTFGSTGALSSHMRRAHSRPGPYSATAEDKQVSRALHSQDGLPICKHCKRHFSKWQQFLQHISRGLCPVLLERAMSGMSSLSTPLESRTPNIVLDPMAADVLLRVVTGGPRILLRLPSDRKRLSHHCAFCSQWVVTPRILKAHIRRSHDSLWLRHHDAASLYCRQHSGLLGAQDSCRLCGVQLKNLQQHALGCPVLVQAGIAFSSRRELWPHGQWGSVGTLQTILRWQRSPGPRTVRQLGPLAPAVIQAHGEDGWGYISDDLAQQLTTSCVLCGAALKGNPNTKRHYKSAHLAHWQSLSSTVARSCASGAACKPCCYCKRPFSSSKAVHLQTCSVLFQWRFLWHLLAQDPHGYGNTGAANGSPLRGRAAAPVSAAEPARGVELGFHCGDPPGGGCGDVIRGTTPKPSGLARTRRWAAEGRATGARTSTLRRNRLTAAVGGRTRANATTIGTSKRSSIP